MKVYQVSVRHKCDGHKGYYFFSRLLDVRTLQAQAVKAEEETEVTIFNVPLTKSGILHALNVHGGHADNG